MEPRDKQGEVPPSVGSYSKHPSDGCITADTGEEEEEEEVVVVVMGGAARCYSPINVCR